VTLARRTVLRMFGSAPLAAKIAADAEIARLSGARVSGLVDNWAPGAASGGAPIGDFSNEMSYEERVNKARGWIHVTGIPDILLKKIQHDCVRVTALDPDIAAKRSWSMAVKIITQRERNIQHAIASYTEDHDYYGVRRAMKKLLGFEWPF